MTQESSLQWFFILFAVVFVIAVVLLAVGFVRSRRREGGTSPGGPTIKEGHQPIANRLGEDKPGQYGEDPRGDDIGGNFDTIPEGDKSKKP